MVARPRAGENIQWSDQRLRTVLILDTRDPAAPAYGYGPCGRIQATSASMGMRMPSSKVIAPATATPGRADDRTADLLRGRATALLDSINPSGPK